MTQTSIAPTLLHLDSIDDYLGPASKRFFGRGYRRIRYTIAPPAGGTEQALRTTATVHYPPDWSTKGGTDQRPHLSTIDALLLGQLACEAAAIETLDLSESSLARSYIKNVSVRAGRAPDEDLSAIPIEVTHQDGETNASVDSRFQVSVGNMALTYTIGQTAQRPSEPARRRSEENPSLCDVQVNRQQHSAHAVLIPGSTPNLLPHSNLERDYDGCVSLVDGFVAALQVGQVLLYELDRMSRDESNTLWMRHTVLTTEPPGKVPADRPLPIAVHLEGSRQLTLAGGNWRTADIVGELAGMSIRCSVAHQLPERLVSRPGEDQR